MFAVALWTSSTRRLVLARDRMGIKPLYIARRGEDLFFGSELKAILVHPEIERNLSLEGLDCYLSLNYVPAPWTLVDGIEKVLPGTWVEWRDGKLRTEAYWRLPDCVPSQWTLESAKEDLDSLLQQSIREHLLSDVPLGVWLSGGVDSSTILHYAAQASSSRLKTFSISFVAAASTRRSTSRKRWRPMGRSTSSSTSIRSRTCKARLRSLRTTPTNPAPTPERCRCGFYPSSARPALRSR